MIRFSLAAALTLAVMGPMAGCATSAPQPATPTVNTGAVATAAPVSDTATVSIQGFQFNPPAVSVKVGGSVTFTNNDGTPHTVTPTAGGAFTDAGKINGGQSVTVTFATAGVQHYQCSFHPSMIGTVNVQ